MSETSSKEWDATTYHRISDPQFQWGQKVLARLHLRGDETVMDAGCGSGRLTAKLLEQLPKGHVIALDNSATMLKAARAYLVPQFGDRVSFVQLDLSQLVFEKAFYEKIDALFSTATFHWTPNHTQLFQGVYRALKPGGYLVAQCGGEGNLSPLFIRVAEQIKQPDYADYFRDWRDSFHFADKETTKERLGEAGFVDIETSLQNELAPFATIEAYAEFIKAVVVRDHLQRLPTASLREAFVATLAAQATNDAPPLVLDYVRLNLYAKKPNSPSTTAILYRAYRAGPRAGDHEGCLNDVIRCETPPKILKPRSFYVIGVV